MDSCGRRVEWIWGVCVEGVDFANRNLDMKGMDICITKFTGIDLLFYPRLVRLLGAFFFNFFSVLLTSGGGGGW